MEEVEEEKKCVFEESIEIDFDYEFDVAKFYDFTKFETIEEIIEAEFWFDLAQGHAPSPLLAKLENGTDDYPESVISSPRHEVYSEYSMEYDVEQESQVSSIVERTKGSQMQKPKSKPTTQSNCPASSRLLQPTASLLAKKKQEAGVRSTRVPTRHQKSGNPPKYTVEIDDTKRQKLEIGYLRKASQLKHQTKFAHKQSKTVATTVVNSHAKPKATIPKEPVLATSHRGVRQRSKNAQHLGNNETYNHSSFKAMPSNSKVLETQSSFKTKKKLKPPLPQFQIGMIANGSGASEYTRTKSNKALQQEKSDQSYNSRDRPLKKKVVSCKGDIGVLQISKRETNVPRESKLSSSKKMSQDPPTEMFSKMSLHPKNDLTLSREGKILQQKVLEKNASFSSMQENKNPNAVTGNSMRCSGIESKMIADIVHHLMNARSFTIY